MKNPLFLKSLVTLLLLASPMYAVAKDTRQKITMPPMRREHMLNNMRDHLRSLQEIQAALAKSDFDKAADIAEQRLGISSLEVHGAAHMAPYMPKAMQEIGTEMHRAASRLAQTAQEATVNGEMAPVLDRFSRLLQQCIACHESYRIK